MYQRCLNKGLVTADAAKSVETFTLSWIGESMGSDCEDCPICTLKLAETAAEGAEVAVKTRCGHIIGKDCLQSWVDSWHADGKQGVPTCPNCRTPLHNYIALLPSEMQPVMREWVAYARGDEELDKTVDGFLLGARETEIDGCYIALLGSMLAKLETRRERFAGYMRVMEDVLEQDG
jgi:hypothetical protein